MRTPTLTLSGFNASIRVARGHLEVQDGAFFERTSAKLPRVRHGITHILLLGADGYLTLAALSWMRAQNIALSILDRRGHIISQIVPQRPSDARIRRAQHRAIDNGLGLLLAKELISRKLVGQERLLRERLHNPFTADRIAQLREHLDIAESLDDIRHVEAAAARNYWGAWKNLPILWSRPDVKKVPEHWRTVGPRVSPLAARLSPRHAINPPNAILNFLYCLLESQCRIAAVGAGLDAGLGLLHADSKQRDSLALDLMEPLRPLVDAAVLDLMAKPLNRRDYYECPDGTCRLNTETCRTLASLALEWQPAALAVAGLISRELAKSIPHAINRPRRGRDLKKRRE